MPGLYASLYTGLSGLQAQQAALNVVGHNIANVNTPGYSRQRADLSSNPSMIEGRLSFGTGVTLNTVQGLRDRFLDLQIGTETAKQSGATERYAGVEAVASSLGDTGDTGIAATIQTFFQGFQNLSAQPENSALRQDLVGKAQTMIGGLQSRYTLLDNQRNSLDQGVKSLVDQVNTLSGQIAQLNKRITGEVSVGADNDARDQRTVLTDKLASLVGINVMEGDRGAYQISLDSGAGVLVGGSVSYDLKAESDPSTGHYLVKSLMGTNTTDVTASIKNGQLGAKLDLRDNILVKFQQQLDQVAAGVAGAVNKLHVGGYSLDGTQKSLYFFNGGPASDGSAGDLLPTGISAANKYKGMVRSLAVNALIVADPNKIAAATTSSPGNNGNALAMALLASRSDTVDSQSTGTGDQGFSTAVGTLVSDLGTKVQEYKAQSDTQQNLLVALQTQRDRTSAVDLDEEAANMMTLQRGYQASARFLSVINQLTDQLVNQFGQ